MHELDKTGLEAARKRLQEDLDSFDSEVVEQLSTEGERADLWDYIDVNVDDLRTVLSAPEALSTTSAGVTEEQVEALTFYAEQWEQDVDAERTATGWEGALGDVSPTPDLCADKGEKARRALAALEASRSPVSQKEAGPVAQLDLIEEMLSAGQGDDDGSQILPDFDEGMTTVAKVEACLFLLEKRRDVIEAFEASPATNDRLYDANAPMADGEIEMTAAENVLAWLIIEKIGVPDDRGYSPNEAQEILVRRLDYANELENESLRSALHTTPTPVSAPVGVVEMATAALEGLIECHDAFNASYGNMEDAYYKLAKYAYPKWHAARDALAALRSPAVEGK